MIYHLQDKVVLITGASGGIGASCARELYKLGAKLVLTDLSQKALDTLAAEFAKERVLAMAMDVTDWKSIKKVTNIALSTFGKIDIVFANAGISWKESAYTVFNCDESEFKKILEVDLLGVWRTIKSTLPEVVKNKGQVVVTSSIYAFTNGMCNAPYATSKAGIEMLARSLRAELAGKSASASVLYPGWITTPLTEGVFGGDSLTTKMREIGFPPILRNTISPEKVAKALVKGLQHRKPRIIVPARWVPIQLFRGIVGIFSDWFLANHTRIQSMLLELEDRTKK
ncbi:SDR family NAD(P)-dependent oxidoreductase [Leptospira sp. 2 VSF19]|uniref:SDR family NAD(P)-dependent oxidoreductase n=1 Tax=Leptospira soteropolitanensis TaxID=2950025 RepID=A0AAW5VST4_9LEPT|nr:SDR family NAD(P)-dependent oxidoreductase [Leptospira soteropolitanensis]MCW7494271.1 SDR family NAD(P)-dependent oxidoreductase [Leptospira soteropolitanensis]MCW7501754.1 SDR family NAD(P)-dependent oxidoreductase [Leptospira soteropolitanensis]MCW7524117.1 SDR family NAD(P)-dependent oxidoreductase [Leptospira soteropolitanensis]MCW7527982.1 SDR family NAD(P)-dependent oxidoreductase [Leptospira soteropolitanensis]MCW7531724.1 SDR family NAD(P)-dependent oxidoreductase [Leptospira soter